MVYHAGRSSVMAYFFHLNQVMVGAPTDDPFRPIKHYPTLIPSQVTPPQNGCNSKNVQDHANEKRLQPSSGIFLVCKKRMGTYMVFNNRKQTRRL